MKSQEELQLFVKRKLKSGYPEGELLNDLLQEGYTHEEIQKAIYDPPATGIDPVTRHRTPPVHHPLWFVFTSALGIVGLAFVSVGIFNNRTIGYILLAAGLIGLLIKYIIPVIIKNNTKQ